MNLFLHGIDGEPGEVCLIETGDSFISDTGTRYDMVMTNPPFGKKSSITLTANGDVKADKGALTYGRQTSGQQQTRKPLKLGTLLDRRSQLEKRYEQTDFT